MRNSCNRGADIRFAERTGSPGTSPLVTLLESPDSTVRMRKNAGNVIDTAGAKSIKDSIQARTSP
ncbi:MAG: hypothetical protein BGO98_02500 [Myxococcales bacterium 68-20]|nr:hypothetical protein [Myxococcales bacterium]OJY21716.1 MAG: hypothetical protein BGO98_02500 [Myxococcales bacterium 68-20]